MWQQFISKFPLLTPVKRLETHTHRHTHARARYIFSEARRYRVPTNSDLCVRVTKFPAEQAFPKSASEKSRGLARVPVTAKKKKKKKSKYSFLGGKASPLEGKAEGSAD